MFYKSVFSLFFAFIAFTTIAAETASVQLYPQVNSVQAKGSKKKSWAKAINWARHNLPQYGKLVRKSDGYVYLKVDDDYIYKLLPRLGLKKRGYRAPPYFRSKEAPGAHISVFYAHEKVFPFQLGQTFSFTLKKFRIVHVNPYTAYAILEVESPALEQLRRSYGLSAKLFGHTFHISVGKQIRKSK